MEKLETPSTSSIENGAITMKSNSVGAEVELRGRPLA
jgi:hypothetical protein